MYKKLEDELKEKKLTDFILANQTRGVSYADCARYMDVFWKTIKHILESFPKEKRENLKKFIIDGRIIDKSIPINFPEGIPSESENEESISEEVNFESAENQKNIEELNFEADESKEFEQEVELKLEEINVLDPVLETKLEETKKKKDLLPIKLSEFVYPTEFVENSDVAKLKRSWVFDLTEFKELTLDDIKNVIKQNEIQYNSNFVFFESDLIYLNAHKDIDLAQKLLQLIALGKEYISFEKGPKPEDSELIKFCKAKGYQLITGSPYMLAWCKVYRVWCKLAENVKIKYKYPFLGKGVVGIDTCVFGCITEPEVSKFEKVLISDLQLKELKNRNKNKFFNTIAIYGDFKPIEDYDDTQSNDWNIIRFYSMYKVDHLFTADYGFMAFARFYDINCEYICPKKVAYSSILELCQNAEISSISSNVKNLIFEQLDIGEIIFSKKYKYYVYPFKNQYIINAYTKCGRKVLNINNRLEIQRRYFICIENKKNDKIILAIIENLESRLAKVIYVGSKNNLPNKYKKFTY